MQSIKFAATGIINTLVSFIIYCLCFSVLKLNYNISLIFAYLFGILNSYLWNSKWTFQTKSFNQREFIKFILVYISTFILNLLILHIEIKIIGMNELASQGAALVIAAFVSFVSYKYWVFRQKQ
jgi:putative flippase GtrA